MASRLCERCGGAIEQVRGRPRRMHPDCRYEDRLEYWRARTKRKRGQLELAGPALMPLLSVLANDKQRRELAEFASWAVETSRRTLAGDLSVRQMTPVQRHLKYAETIHALTAQAPAASELRLAKRSEHQ